MRQCYPDFSKLQSGEKILVTAIAKRSFDILKKHKALNGRKAIDIQMDLVATHQYGNKLDFQRLHDADEFNIMHDVQGIYHHLDRTTGKLMDCFVPRMSLRDVKKI